MTLHCMRVMNVLTVILSTSSRASGRLTLSRPVNARTGTVFAGRTVSVRGSTWATLRRTQCGAHFSSGRRQGYPTRWRTRICEGDLLSSTREWVKMTKRRPFASDHMKDKVSWCARLWISYESRNTYGNNILLTFLPKPLLYNLRLDKLQRLP